MLETTTITTSQRDRQRVRTAVSTQLIQTGRFSLRPISISTTAPGGAQPTDSNHASDQPTDPKSNAAIDPAPPTAADRQLLDLSGLDSIVTAGITQAARRVGALREKGIIQDAPGAAALETLGFLFRGGIAPARTLVSAYGELSLVFFGCTILSGGSHARLATLTFDGEETVLSLEDRIAKTFNATIVETSAAARRDAVLKISEFVA